MVREKTFDVTYTVLNDDGQYDVSFELSEEAEDALFNGLAHRIHGDAENGAFDGETIHLYKKLTEQKQSYPPWFEADSNRTYDLQLTTSEYNTLTLIIGQQLGNVLRPGGADRYDELVQVWRDITEQMRFEDELERTFGDEQQQTLQSVIDENWKPIPNPDNGTFKCFIHDKQIVVYENERTEQTWHYCRSCGMNKPNIGGDHECI